MKAISDAPTMNRHVMPSARPGLLRALKTTREEVISVPVGLWIRFRTMHLGS